MSGYSKKSESQLIVELKHNEWVRRFWAASWVLKSDHTKLKKKAISTLFDIFDNQIDWQLRDDIADMLGKHYPDNEVILRGLIKRISTGDHSASGGISLAIVSETGVKILLSLLNDPDPTIRQNTLQFFFSEDGADITKEFIGIDVIMEFEENLEHLEARRFFEHWINFYPREI